MLETFLALSSVLTGFPRVRLVGTGQADRYFDTVTAAAGSSGVEELLQTFSRIAESADEATMEQQLRSRILSDEQFGPVARNIIKLWMVGTWYQLPGDWRAAFGIHRGDETHVPSPDSYVEGLLWPLIDANPSGAKGPGYGTWAYPPQIQVP